MAIYSDVYRGVWGVRSAQMSPVRTGSVVGVDIFILHIDVDLPEWAALQAKRCDVLQSRVLFCDGNIAAVDRM